MRSWTKKKIRYMTQLYTSTLDTSIFGDQVIAAVEVGIQTAQILATQQVTLISSTDHIVQYCLLACAVPILSIPYWDTNCGYENKTVPSIDIIRRTDRIGKLVDLQQVYTPFWHCRKWKRTSWIRRFVWVGNVLKYCRASKGWYECMLLCIEDVAERV